MIPGTLLLQGGVNMKAFVDKNTCISCGLCVSICPAVFAMDDDGRATAILADVPEGSWDNAKDAEQSCPSSSVMLEY